MSWNRREFLVRGGRALVVGALGSCASASSWRQLRFVRGEDASELELAVLSDASELFARAIGSSVPIVGERQSRGPIDLLVGTPETARFASPEMLPSSRAAGAFRVAPHENGLAVVGRDPEGARNALYAVMERLGFGFFRDGPTCPRLEGPVSAELEMDDAPVFRWRGDMIWDNYVGPKRYCASVWDDEDWDRALVFMARNRMNFLEFYPPMESVFATAFPSLEGLDDASVWKSKVKLDLAKRALARGRGLGIHFMYVLSYGSFPEPVRRHYSHLEWRNGFLCAHQPELMELTERVWRALVSELGTDHWYAIRHRGEEDQSYSDPCRSVTKAEGFQQAFEVMDRVDPESRITVWTWGEELPDLFEGFPLNVRAAHIRHGMANVFAERSAGREQKDGRPDVAARRKWLSGQFTVFGGNETGLQTGWSDARSLARDALASAADGQCEGYFQWPEWSDTSPWLSHVIAKLAWNPEMLGDVELMLRRYADERHGARAGAFLAGFRPLILDGNARFMYPPRKRLVVPYLLTDDCLKLLHDVRSGAQTMVAMLDDAPDPFQRDFVDLMTWIGVRQAQTLEADMVRSSSSSGESASATWSALHDLLVQVPELSIVEAARSAARLGELSAKAEDSFWTLACDFYHGYPLVMSPEAIELVYLPQLRRLLEGSGELEAPGWFWHDFPEAKWAESVRQLPSEDAKHFEAVIRERIRHALSSPGAGDATGELDPGPALKILELELPSGVSL